MDGNYAALHAAAVSDEVDGEAGGGVSGVGGGKTVPERARAALFGAFLVLASASTSSRAWYLALAAVGELQLLLFPLSPALPWRTPGAPGNAVASFHAFLGAVAFSPWRGADGAPSPYSRVALFAVAAAFTLVLLGGLAFFAGVDSSAAGAARRWRAGALRALLTVALVAAPAPLVGNLLSPLVCDAGTWGGVACWTAPHTVAAIFGVLLAAAAAALLVLLALLFRAPAQDLKTNPTGAAHGRAEAVAVLVKAALAALFVLGPTLSPWVHALANLAGAGLLLGLIVYFLPFYDQTLNRALAALHAALAAAAAAAVLCVGLVSAGAPAAAAGAAYVWLCVTPLALFVGWSAAAERWRALARSRDLGSVYVIELRARHLVAECAQAAADGAAASSARAAHDRDAALPAGHPGIVAPGGVCPVGFGGEGVAVGSGGDGSGDGARGDAAWRADAPAEAGSAASRALDALLVDASVAHTGSPMMHVFTAAATRGAGRNRHLERMHLRAAAANADANTLDVHFVVVQRLAQLQEEDHKLSGGRMTVELRLHFDALQAAAEARVARLRGLVLSFWQILCERKPDLTALAAKGRAIQDALREAGAIFRDLLVMAPTSVPVLRAYAAFLQELANDPALAAELLADADQLEDESSRATDGDVNVIFGAPTELDLTADGVATIRVAAQSDAGNPAGAITHANLQTLKLFGYSANRRELLGRDMSLLLPEPIAAVHGRFLAAFASDGHQRMTGASRILFGLHRAGHIFPMRINVYPSTDSLTAAMEELRAGAMSYLFCAGAEGGFRITAACRSAMTRLGFSAVALKTGGLALGTYVADPAAAVRMLGAAGAAGGVLALRSGAAARAGRGAAVEAQPFFVRLQEVRIAFLAGPLLILRFLPAGDALVAASAAAGRFVGWGDGAAAGEATAASDLADGARADDSAARSGASSDAGSSNDGARSDSDDGSGDPARGARAGAAGGAATDADALLFDDLDAAPPPPAAPPPRASGADGAAARGAPLQSILRQRPVALDRAQPPPALPLDDDEGADKKPAGAVAARLVAPSARMLSARSGASVVSGGSSMTHATSVSPAEIVRRSVSARAGRLEKSLISLRRSVLWSFAAVAFMNVASLVITTIAFSALVDNFHTVVDAATRAVLVERGTEQVQLQVFSNLFSDVNGTVPYYKFEDEVGFLFSNERIRTTVDRVEALHRALYLQADATSDAARQTYLAEVWSMRDLVPGSYQSRDAFATTVRNVSLANIVLEYVARQRSFWWYPIEQVQAYDLDTFWIENNAPGNVMAALNSSLFDATASTSSLLGVVKASNIAVVTIALSVFAAITLLVMLPAVSEVLREQRVVYDVFAVMPLRMVRKLRDDLTQAIAAARSADDGDAAGDAAVAIAADARAGVHAEAADGPGRPLGGSAAGEAADDDAAASRRACCRGCGAARRVSAVAPARARERRQYRRVTSGKAVILLRMLWPIAVFSAYFAGVFVWRQAVADFAVNARSETLWGAELEVLAPSVAYSLRNAVAYRERATWVPFWINKTQEQIDLMSELVDAIAYGSAARSTRSALASSASAYKLLLQNGCVHNEVDAAACAANYGTKPCVYYYVYDFCYKPSEVTDINYRVFFYGLVGTGLLPAMKQYLLLARNVLQQRRDDLAAGGLLPRVDLTAGPLAFVNKLGTSFLPAGLESLSASRVAENDAALASFQSMNVIATVASVLAIGVIYLFVYRPLFFMLDREIKSTRGLLLLLPDDAARQVPAVLEAVSLGAGEER